MLTNEERARRAAKALLAYSDPDDEFINLLDFLADLMHLCGRKDYDFEHALSLARMHFEEEQDDEERGEPPTQVVRVASAFKVEGSKQ